MERIEKYKLKTNDFILKMDLKVFDKDVNIPVNSILNIKIYSDNFSAVTTMDIDIKMLQKFARKLSDVYTSLQGCAELKETYGNSFIMFRAMNNGHIYVTGNVNSHCRNGYEQELKFESEFDQSYLKAFVNAMNQ